MKDVAYSLNDPVLSGAEMAAIAIAREIRVTWADCFGPSVVSPGRTPTLELPVAAPACRAG